MNKKYIVRLTEEERAVCEATIKKETGKSYYFRVSRELENHDSSMN